MAKQPRWKHESTDDYGDTRTITEWRWARQAEVTEALNDRSKWRFQDRSRSECSYTHLEVNDDNLNVCLELFPRSRRRKYAVLKRITTAWLPGREPAPAATVPEESTMPRTDATAAARPAEHPLRSQGTLIRAALRESFPGVTFSARTKAHNDGLAYVVVSWTDGPTATTARAIAERLTGRKMLDGAAVQFPGVFQPIRTISEDERAKAEARWPAMTMARRRKLCERLGLDDAALGPLWELRDGWQTVLLNYDFCDAARPSATLERVADLPDEAPTPVEAPAPVEARPARLLPAAELAKPVLDFLRVQPATGATLQEVWEALGASVVRVGEAVDGLINAGHVEVLRSMRDGKTLYTSRDRTIPAPVEAAPAPEAPTLHTYGCTMRPPLFGGSPDGQLSIDRRPRDGAPHGTVTYDRELTAAELARFDLVPFPGGQAPVQPVAVTDHGVLAYIRAQGETGATLAQIVDYFAARRPDVEAALVRLIQAREVHRVGRVFLYGPRPLPADSAPAPVEAPPAVEAPQGDLEPAPARVEDDPLGPVELPPAGYTLLCETPETTGSRLVWGWECSRAAVHFAYLTRAQALLEARFDATSRDKLALPNGYVILPDQLRAGQFFWWLKDGGSPVSYRTRADAIGAARAHAEGRGDGPAPAPRDPAPAATFDPAAVRPANDGPAPSSGAAVVNLAARRREAERRGAQSTARAVREVLSRDQRPAGETAARNILRGPAAGHSIMSPEPAAMAAIREAVRQPVAAPGEVPFTFHLLWGKPEALAVLEAPPSPKVTISFQRIEMGEDCTFSTFREANAKLREWSEDAPTDGCYGKIGFTIAFPELFPEAPYTGRCDLKHHSVETADIRRQALDFIRFRLGDQRPAHMTPQAYEGFLRSRPIAPDNVDTMRAFILALELCD